jgi:hypothetical protein
MWKRQITMIHTEIQVKDRLDPQWADWFEEMQIRDDHGRTILYGSLPDKSSVYGILSRLSSLGIILLSVTCQEEANHNTGWRSCGE